MPWTPEDAPKKNKKARSARCKRAFSETANSVLRKTGDDGKAIRIGNSAVDKCIAAKKRTKSKQLIKRTR